MALLDQVLAMRAQNVSNCGGVRDRGSGPTVSDTLGTLGNGGDLLQRQPERFQRENAIEARDIADRVAAVAGARAPGREQPAPLVVMQRLGGDAGQIGKGAYRVVHTTSLGPDLGEESSVRGALNS